MADRRSNQKRTREEYEEESPSELALTSLHSENQEDQDSSPIRRIQEDQDSSVPISRIQGDQDSSVPKNVDTLECHVHTFDSQFVNDMGTMNFIVPGDHMILVVHSDSKVDLFTRHGVQILALEEDDGSHQTYAMKGSIRSVCYDKHDNSFLIEYNMRFEQEEAPSELALTSLHSENQEDQDSSPIRRIQEDEDSSLPNNVDTFECHVHTFDSQFVNDMGTINFIVPRDHMILVVHSHRKVDLFTRYGDQIFALEDDDGSHQTYAVEGSIRSVCYNKHDNSFLIEYMRFEQEILGLEINIVTLRIASIEGRSSEMRCVFPGESNIVKWDFDIPMCRGMIHNCKDRKFKFCELKEYSLLFTIPDFGSTQVGSGGTSSGPYFKSLYPGNMDMVMFDTVSSSLNGIHLRFYSKVTGVLQKEIFLPQPEPSDQQYIEFIAPCGTDRVLVQRHLLEMEVVEMSYESPVSIIKRRNTKIRAACDPYYLHERSQFICYTESKAIHVCNLQGEILVTLEDHPLHSPSFFVHSYISSSQDILISLCCGQWMSSVNVSSIVTGECLSKIRKAASNPPVVAFAYDERTHEIFTGTDNGVCGVLCNKFHNDVGDESEEWDESDDE